MELENGGFVLNKNEGIEIDLCKRNITKSQAATLCGKEKTKHSEQQEGRNERSNMTVFTFFFNRLILHAMVTFSVYLSKLKPLVR